MALAVVATFIILKTMRRACGQEEETQGVDSVNTARALNEYSSSDA